MRPPRDRSRSEDLPPGGAGATKQMNHPTTGRIPAGGRVERSLAFDFNRLAPVSLLLREPDFSTAGEISDAINREFGHEVASARDGGRVEVRSERRPAWRT